MQSYLSLQSLQGFKLQTGQLDLDVFWNIWDEEGQDELEGQQPMLKSQNNKHIIGIKILKTKLCFASFLKKYIYEECKYCFKRDQNIMIVLLKSDRTERGTSG